MRKRKNVRAAQGLPGARDMGRLQGVRAATVYDTRQDTVTCRLAVQDAGGGHFRGLAKRTDKKMRRRWGRSPEADFSRRDGWQAKGAGEKSRLEKKKKPLQKVLQGH